MSHKYNGPRRQRVHPVRPGATGQCAQLRQQRTRTACRAPAVTSANGAPSRPAGRLQPCRFDLLPPCTPITARQRTRRSGWASRAARIGPLPGDQATVPPHDGTRRDQPVRPQPSRQEPDQRGQHRGGPSPIGPRLRCGAAPRPRAQHEQFRIFERRRTTQRDKPASKPHEDQIEQTQRHGRSLCPTATPHLSRQVTAIGRLLAPHRPRRSGCHPPGCTSFTQRSPPASVTTLVHCRMISSVTELPEQDFTAQKETTRPSSQAHCP
jgi:hypothetical protein